VNEYVKTFSGESEYICNLVFKTVKDKMVQLVLKDTAANVRDAAVTLFKTFMGILKDQKLIEEAIKVFPKYRVQEILKSNEVLDPKSKTVAPVSAKPGSRPSSHVGGADPKAEKTM